MQIIKELRKEKRVTQTHLAEAVGVSLRTIQTYEKKGANIPTKRLSKIAEYFELNVIDLHIREVNEEEATYGNQKPFDHFGCRCYPLDFGKYFMLVRLVLGEMQTEYIESVKNQKKPKDSMKTGFVLDTLEDGAYLAFEVIGDTMNNGCIESVPNKAIVLGVEYTTKEFLSDCKSFLNQIMVFVLKDRVMCKQLVAVDKATRNISCHNLNTSPEFRDFDLNLDGVLQIFKVVKKQM